jgi:hypothetical protein
MLTDACLSGVTRDFLHVGSLALTCIVCGYRGSKVLLTFGFKFGVEIRAPLDFEFCTNSSGFYLGVMFLRVSALMLDFKCTVFTSWSFC